MADPIYDPAGGAFNSGLKLARKTPVSFCFMLDKTGKAPALMFHRTKAGKVLYKMAKGFDAGFTKGTYGTALLEGKTLTIDCDRELAGLVKACKQWRANARHPLIKAIVVQLEGQPIEDSDAVPEQEDRTAQGGKAKPETTRALGLALSKALKEAKGKLPPETLQALTKKASEALKTGDNKSAAMILALLHKIGQKKEAKVDYSELLTLATEWVGLRKTGIKQAKLVTKLMLQDQPELLEQAKTLGKLYSIFDQKLAATLIKLSKNPDINAQKALLTHARKTTANYMEAINKDRLFAHMANNPYVEMNPGKDLSPTLNKINKTLQGF